MAEHKWAGVHEGKPWSIEVSYDRFLEQDPFVVDVWVDFDKNDCECDRGAFMTPEQARELADALRENADMCERANADAPPRKELDR